MPFVKGKSGNINGRKKGVPNKTTGQLREAIQMLVESNLEHVQAIFNDLEPKDKLKFLTDLLPFVLPKLQNTDINATIEGPAQLPAVIIHGFEVQK